MDNNSKLAKAIIEVGSSVYDMDLNFNLDMPGHVMGDIQEMREMIINKHPEIIVALMGGSNE